MLLTHRNSLTCMSLHDMHKVIIKQVSNNSLTEKNKVLKYKKIYIYAGWTRSICSTLKAYKLVILAVRCILNASN